MNTINDKNIPICRCHNLPKVWENDSRKKKGGFWRCTVRNKQRRFNWNNSIRGYIRKREWQLKEKRKNAVNKLKELQNVN